MTVVLDELPAEIPETPAERRRNAVLGMRMQHFAMQGLGIILAFLDIPLERRFVINRT